MSRSWHMLVLVCIVVALWSAIALFTPESEVNPETNLRHLVRNQSQLAFGSIPESKYLADRGCKISGRIIDIAGAGQEADVLVLDVGMQLESWKRYTEVDFRRPGQLLPMQAEMRQRTTKSGMFEFAVASYGQKAIYFYSTGFAPMVRRNVAVRDGLGAWQMGGTLQPAKYLSVTNIPLTDGAFTWLPIYIGRWPDLDWSTVESKSIQLEFRYPDGWPLGLAIKSEDGITYRALPVDLAEMGNEVVWENLELLDWAEGERLVDDYHLWLGTNKNESGLGLHAESPSPPSELQAENALGTGLASLTTNNAFAWIGIARTTVAQAPLRGRMGVDRLIVEGVAYRMADEYGEAVFSTLPSGRYLAVTSLKGGGWTETCGIVIEQGTASRTRFGALDSRQISDLDELRVGEQARGKLSCTLTGFLAMDSERQLPVRGKISLAGFDSTAGQIWREAESDVHGFFRLQGLPPHGEYLLRWGFDEKNNSVGSYCVLEVPEQLPNGHLGERFQPLLLVVPSQMLAVQAPAEGQNEQRRLVLIREGRTEFFHQLEAGAAEVTIRRLEPGSYELRLIDSRWSWVSSVQIPSGSLGGPVRAEFNPQNRESVQALATSGQ